ncbi:hypothetical protein FIA58_010190 [Flavobacterium jejuense]|uniref:Secreted protein n=1 Tax=Flavobacterium jejuense TaxID=1544455 RepID=A0ABX0IT93_9FLAO|nr:hypothetical protein [Flavobacterium jejuense]NHN26044.1 hypothetical protein [Flavobacterium jejuense]
MRKIVLILIIVFSLFSQAQEKYKYVVVPGQFSFFKEPNKYNLNSLTKSFFETEGFVVFYDTENLPNELLKNRCLALYVNVLENNSMFMTKITVNVKDCKNEVLVISEEGSSREKDYDKAYNQTLRTALTSLKGKLNFKTSENLTGLVDQQIVPEKKGALEDLIPVSKEIGNKSALYALPTETGFKLVNAIPNVIFELQKTSIDNLFLGERGMMDNGIFYKKDESWFYEYYKKDKLIIEKVDVKF